MCLKFEGKFIRFTLEVINYDIKTRKKDAYTVCPVYAGMVDFAPKWVRLASNGTNPGLFQIRFQCIWRPRAKCTEI